MTWPGPDPNALPRVPDPHSGHQHWGAQEMSNSYGPPPPLAYQPPQQYYPTAQHVTVNVPRPFNHGLHIVLDLASCGLWIPVHLLLRALHRG